MEVRYVNDYGKNEKEISYVQEIYYAVGELGGALWEI